MQKVIISIVFHSDYGHTEQVAKRLYEELQSDQAEVHLIPVCDAESALDQLHQSDTIIFGSPTHFGGVSAAFKKFMEQTGSFWYKQLWKDKLAAGFTNSSTLSGDKLNTLISISLFAAQHSMHWINLGIMPRFINDEQTDGQNRISAYIGLMTQSDNSIKEVSPIHSGDLVTIQLFAHRILQVTIQLKYKQTLKNKNV